MSVSGTNTPGNGTAVSTFTSGLGNGIITVDHNSTTPNSLGNWGAQDNINSAINPSMFAALFPGTGNVQGHVAQSMYGDPNPPPGSPAPIPNVTTVTFHLTSGNNGYNGYLPDLIFGIWNTTTEVGMPVYNIQLKDSGGFIVSPTTLNFFGRDDNTGSAGVLGLHQLLFTPSSGDLTFNPANLPNGAIHTDAIFLNKIPLGTQEIIVTGTLPALNNLGDGVGYYFVETPEPSTFVLGGLGILGLAAAARRRQAATVKRLANSHA